MDEEIRSEEIQEVADPVEVVESEEMQEVAEPVGHPTNKGGEAFFRKENAEETEVKEEEDIQKHTKNDADSRFAQMRRELADFKRNESALKEQNSRFMEIMSHFGFNGSTPEEVADAAEAHYSGKDISEIRAERERKAQETNEIEQLREEARFYRERENQRIFEEDLKTIQKLNPEIKSLSDLGPDFIRLKAAGVDTEVAYNAVYSKKAAEKITPPPKVGSVNSKTKPDKTFYTPEEVDRLTDKELDDPKIFENVMKSMTKWGKGGNK